jgi:hypothetical protein
MARRFVVYQIDRETGQETERCHRIHRDEAQGIAEYLTKYPSTDAERGAYYEVREVEVPVAHHAKGAGETRRMNVRKRDRST